MHLPAIPGGWIAAILLVLAGLVLCFAGSRLVRVALGLAGFLVTGTLAATITGLATQSPPWFLVAFVLGGIVGGALAGALLVPGMFILGLAFGHAVSSAFIPSTVVAWIAAGLCGVLFVLLKERVLALGTAGLKALLTLEGLVLTVLEVNLLADHVAPVVDGPAGAIGTAVVWILLSLVGYRSQIKGRRKKNDDD